MLSGQRRRRVPRPRPARLRRRRRRAAGRPSRRRWPPCSTGCERYADGAPAKDGIAAPGVQLAIAAASSRARPTSPLPSRGGGRPRRARGGRGLSLRGEFPVFERAAFLNAGSDGPVPRRAVEAARRRGRATGARAAATPTTSRAAASCAQQQRAAYAALLGCAAGRAGAHDVHHRGDRDRRGRLRARRHDRHLGRGAPRRLRAARPGAWARSRDRRRAVRPRSPRRWTSRTTAVVCSHVSWVSGALAPAELASVGAPVIYDGAQGVGAVPVDVKVLGCAAYAGSGQKWLCGPDGSGMLYVAPEFRERVPTLVAGYATTARAGRGPRRASCGRTRGPGTRRCSPARRRATRSPRSRSSTRPAGTRSTRAASSWPPGWRRCSTTRATRCGPAATRRSSRGSARTRPPSTSARAKPACSSASLPGHDLLRASVGAWNDESDLERLLAAL